MTKTPNTETLRSHVTTWCQHSGSLGVVYLRTTTIHVVELLYYIRHIHISLSNDVIIASPATFPT
jgi:hypothetical protein